MKVFTEEHRAHLRKAALNRKHSDETKRKISESMKDHPVSEDTKKKISSSMRGNTNALKDGDSDDL